MEQKNIPEQKVSEPGQKEVIDPKPATPEPQPVAQDGTKDVEAALALVDDVSKELESAQKKIRHLEKIKKLEGGESDPELVEQLVALKDEVAALREQQATRMTEDSDNLAKFKTRAAELRAALIATRTASNTSLGANQDKSKPEPPLPELNRQQEALYTRIAARKGLTLEQWRKQNSK